MMHLARAPRRPLPRNPLRESLGVTAPLVERLDALRRNRRPERGSARTRRRRGATRRGAAPRQPTGVIAAVTREIERLVRSTNVALVEAIRPYLDLEVIDRATAREARKRLVEFRGGQVHDADAQRIITRTFELTDNFNRRDVARSIGIAAPELQTDVADDWRREHVAKIKHIAPESRDRIVGYLEEVGERGMRVETLRKRLQEVEGMSYRRARLVARDSVLTVNARLTRERHKAAGIEEYEWLTMGAGMNVRDHHAKLNGKRFRYDDPPMGGGTGPNDRGNPGDGIGCRCQAIPVIPEFEPDEAEGPLGAPE